VNESGERKVFRACRSSYIVFGVIHGVLLALWAWAVVVRGWHPTFWWFVGILTGSWTFVYFSLSRFRLVITPESVSYSSLFSPRKEFPRSEITFADFAKTTGSFESPLTFSIRTKSGDEMRINAKVFSLEAVRELGSLRQTKTRSR
jgi:hypothetical protein